LRGLAAAHRLDFGTAVAFKGLSISKYAQIVGSEFSTLTPENEMKWQYIHPVADSYEWFFGDELVNFAQVHQMKVRGHTLVWHNQLPRWVSESVTTKDALLKLVTEHVSTIVSHFRGKIAKWDVANEVIDDSQGMRETLFYRLSGTEFLVTAFRAAHEADADALLYLNDYSVEAINPKSNRLYELCKALLAQGVPLHGVGLQAHWDLDDLPSMNSVRKNIERFAALGLKVDITELDIRMKGAPTPERLRVQADAYAALVRVVLDTEGSDAITVWGVDDGHSWVGQWMSSYGSALLLDGKYRAKQAYAAVAGELSKL
jgi:endo-1,4-beta-xylanase